MSALRLLLLGTRNSLARLLGIVGGVAIGVLLALLLIAGANALDTRDVRGSWMQPSVSDIAEATSTDVLVANLADAFEGRTIDRLDIAVPPNAAGPLPPSELPVPKPGEYVASPALAKLIAETPPDELQQRYGTPAGIIPDSLLRSPDSLYVVVGKTSAQLTTLPTAGAAIEFGGAAYGGNANYQTLALIGALALLIPAFLLVAVATNLGAASRSERWQTLLTIGAPRKFISRIAVLEALGTSLIGSALGVAAFFALRPLFAQIHVSGERLTASDLAVSVGPTLLLCAAVCLGSMLAAARGSRRINTNPASRAVFERSPSAWRLLPLLLGLALFAAVNAFGAELALPAAPLVVLCFVLIALGILYSGPWITWAAGRVFQSVARSASAVVASRRIVRTPRAGFRSVAGLVAATFLISVFAFAATAHVGADAFSNDPVLPADAVAGDVNSGAQVTQESADRALLGTKGVSGVYLTHVDDSGEYLSGDAIRALHDPQFTGKIGLLRGGIYSIAPDGPTVTAVESTAEPLQRMHVSSIIVQTDGRPGSLERARTALLTMDHSSITSRVAQRSEFADHADSPLATEFAEIGRIAILIVTLLAAGVLTISTIAALYDRRRTFGLLSLIGMPANTLRRIITWETLVPLLGIVIPTILIGWFTARMLITTLSADRQIGWPDSLLAISLLATGIMAVASILIAARAGTAITRSSDNTRNE